MPGPAAGESATARHGARVRMRDAIVPLAILLALGFALRLIIAYVLLPGSGFGVDLASFNGWAVELAKNGPFGLYDRDLFVDYTPGYLYVLWLLGLVAQAVGGPGTAPGELLKLPAILADLGLALAIFALAAELGASRRNALIATAVFLFVPVTWFDSAVWAQVDSVGTLILVLAVRELWRGRSERAAILTTIAAIIKPQFGILIPLAAIVILRRHLVERPNDGSRLGGGPVRIVTTTIAGLVTASLVCLPFGLTILGLLQQILETAGGYPYVTVNAYNPWALVTLDGNGLAAAGTWIRDAPNPDNPADAFFAILGAPAVMFGTAILVTAILALVALLWRRHDDRRALLVAIAVMAVAFFVLPTRVHERYLYPFFALGAILLALRPRWGVVYAVLAAANFANMYGVLTLPFYENPGLGPMLDAFGGLGARLGEAFRSTAGVWLAALAHAAGLVAVTYFVLRPAAGETDAEDLPWDEDVVAEAEGGAFAEEAPRGVLDAPSTVLGWLRTPAGVVGVVWALALGAVNLLPIEAGSRLLLVVLLGAAGVVAAVAWERRRRRTIAENAGDPATRSPDVGGAAPEGGTGTGRAGGATIGAASLAAGETLGSEAGHAGAATVEAWDEWEEEEPPAPFDRSARLAREGGGRFDRLDLWLLLLLVIAALVLRTFRLGEPMRMHFDEVYHARTAAEFLQDWRYGEPHGIYEYTHPHFAKYAIAAGLVLFGDDRVVAESDLGTPVRDAAIEPRWDDPAAAEVDPAAPTRGGERVYIATGSSLDVHDLRTRERLASFPVAGAQAVAVDPESHLAYVGTADGAILVLDTTVEASILRGATPEALDAVGPVPLVDAAATGGTSIDRLWVAGDGQYVMAGTPDDGLATFDAATGIELARTVLPGRAEVVDAGRADALVATPAEVGDATAVAAELAGILGGDEAAYAALLETDAPRVVVTSDLTEREALDTAIAEGRLPGLAIEEAALVAVADEAGVTFLDPATGRETASVPLDAPATGLVEVEGLDEPTLYVATGSSLATIRLPAADAAASLDQTVWMPAEVTRVTFDDASQLVHALGRTPDGSGWTIYVVEPRGNSVFADAALPFEPAAWVTDTAAQYPSEDRQQIVAFADDGAAASVAIGQHAFAWRLPGVLAGVLMAALVYLLARILFRRRAIAVLAGALVLVDGMLFAQSRIAMNDAYVALFIVAAVTLFAAIWTGAWRWRGAFWVGLPLVGVLLGLAFASKWVALYALGGIALLILARSALGRVLIVVGLAGIAASLGYMAIATGPDATTGGNVVFLVLMVALTLVAAAVVVLHPVAWTVDEVRIAVAGPAVLGILGALVAIPLGLGPAAIAASVGLMALGGVAAGAFWLGGRFGFGPLAPPPEPDDPAALLPPADAAPDGWLRPGWLGGVPIAWAAVSLLAIPLAVYVVSYLPWVALGNQLWTGFPAGHDGQTLLDLTKGMYEYHNNLRATHAAASPWWAWPANLKPVWFYQESFAGPTVGAIYDGGNLATWWLSIPAFAFVAWQAFRRRSLALALVAMMFASLWLPWARIDRATFQYHYYAALPFVLLALAYFLAEVWHGPTRRTWLLARGAAAGAILAPVGMWLFRGPLCALVDVERANPGSQACSSAASISLSVSSQLAGLLAVLGVAGVLLVWQLLALDRAGATPAGRAESGRRLVWIAITAGIGVIALAATWLVAPTDPLIVYPNVPGEILALGLLIVLGPLAWLVWHATSPRRFVVGAGLVALFVFVLFYPNLSGLPLPNGLYNWYQGLLPTWLYPFQFPVNTDPPVTVSLLGPWPALLFAAIVVAAGVVAYSAWVWRLALAEREADGATEAASG